MPFKEIVENGTIYLEPLHAERALIWLHGLGDTGAGFKPFFKGQEEMSKSVRVILPTAPLRPCKLAGGQTVPSWFDIGSLKELDLTRFVD
jgi:phospholipase/carboxylesterase